MRRRLGTTASLIARLLTWPMALACQLEERRNTGSVVVFRFCAECFALLPGLPGMYLRRAFYQRTLSACADDCHIGFGTLFTHRANHIESGVYIGDYALIGTAVLRRRCLIGSRASLLSGGYQHEIDETGMWGAAEMSRFRVIEVGEGAWIGESAVLMNNVGSGAMVAAGAVVSSSVPARVMVGGNPARFVQRLDGDAARHRSATAPEPEPPPAEAATAP